VESVKKFDFGFEGENWEDDFIISEDYEQNFSLN
jgi:hypothetical protein